jgi:uncharacterized protein (TIGR03118 family)
MNILGVRNRIAVACMTALAALTLALLPFALPRPAHAAAANAYRQTNLVSDLPGMALIQDPDLVNPWGISLSGGSPFWVANNVSGTSTLYAGDHVSPPVPLTKNPLVVTIPGGSPTGTVFNTGASTDFIVKSGAASGRALFLFASQVGIVSGWNPNVPAAGSKQAQVGGTGDAVYTGLAIGQVSNGQGGTTTYLYAADFEHGKIDVYDGAFKPATLDGSFSDPNIPNSYSIFNIQNLGGKLYVTYAQQSHKEPDEETDRGSGFVDVFDTSGHLLQRLIQGNHLRAPWGVALAPADFGVFSNALIVGNFGDGQLHAFDPDSGKYLGELKGKNGKPIVIDGLWGITFGNGGNGGDKNALYFAAGIQDETHGLFGSLRAVPQQ